MIFVKYLFYKNHINRVFIIKIKGFVKVFFEIGITMVKSP